MFTNLSGNLVQKIQKGGVMFALLPILLLDGPNWLENFKRWVEDLFGQLIDFASIILMGVAILVFFAITISGVIRGYNMHRQGVPSRQILQDSLGILGTMLILAVLASLAGAFAATQGIFGPGVESWIRTIFGGG